jgi:hypothetical protein
MIMRAIRWLLSGAVMVFLGTPALAQQHYWYDGATRRPLWAEPGVVADFSGPTREKSAVVSPSALVKSDARRQSPVFRDQAQSGGPARALPGGVLIRFAPGATAAERQAALARHGLTVLRENGPGSGSWLIESPAGEASLALANRLHESGDFEAAAPNWWQPRRLK